MVSWPEAFAGVRPGDAVGIDFADLLWAKTKGPAWEAGPFD